MAGQSDRRYPTDAFGLPEGLLAALIGALLLVGAFALASSSIAMPPSERWAALTTVTLLALGVTLPGCAALYDALGRSVRRAPRAGYALLAIVPALYAAYALAVRELTVADLTSACLVAGVPALALWRAGQQRQPTIFDGLALAYLAVSFWLGLLPELGLPQQGGLVSFFQLASVPLLLLLFALRGWPGVGYSWHLSGQELRDALLAAALGLLIVGATLLLLGALRPPLVIPTAGTVLLSAVGAYFYTALPSELLLRGGIQNGLSRALAPTMGATGAFVALGLVVLGWLGLGMLRGGWPGALAGAVVGAAGGWTYLRSGKVTAAAVSHALIIWLLDLFTRA